MAGKVLYEAVGKAIAVRRKQLGLTQAKLGARVGLTRASIAKIEGGKQAILLLQVYLFAQALDFRKVVELIPASAQFPTGDGPELPIADRDDITQKQKTQISEMISAALAGKTPPRAG
jgi:transcriptional regulator with XRE-family HTH domain